VQTPWSNQRAIEVYNRVFPGDATDETDFEAEEIANEMRAVKAAATIEDAMKVIEWYGGWDIKPEGSLRRAVNRIRKFKCRQPWDTG